MPLGVLLSLAFEFGGVHRIEHAPRFANPVDFRIKTDPETRIVRLSAYILVVCVSNIQAACQLVHAKSIIANFVGSRSARECFYMTIAISSV
jgi:hypothetical protein